ncbi:outer membrane protein assembly factor BamB family protein [Phaeacidiphilus oryzae]|uniref:outer membrane protein assembly factor BamB family protein n=1 Tax=Phaeacidiphilus oryzae TaxID=348818 RepID=UPI00055A0D06|nr:PQQ-binding-like beta-propeller repeat protein [Phaeacidiphilus oryzae]
MEQLTAHDPRRIGQFEVLGRLGAGGMGLVYLARSAAGRRVAIKTVRAELAEDQLFRVRFSREIAAAKKVSGFYTAAVVDADADAPVPWLATAYVPAPSLEDLVTECGPLPVDAVRWITAGIAEALQSIHQVGLVHRDLKPSNVLVTEDGPRVIDFGIAAGVSHTRLTMTNVAVGTPAYMSPEQARDSRGVTAASDVFSLGSLVVFAATGHAPYHGANPVETVFQLLRSETDLSGLPEELDAVVKGLMRPAPEKRTDLASLQSDLAPHLFARVDEGDDDAVQWLPEVALDLIERRRHRRSARIAAQPSVAAPVPSPASPVPPARTGAPAVTRDPSTAPSLRPAPAGPPGRPGRAAPDEPVRLPGVSVPITPGPYAAPAIPPPPAPEPVNEFLAQGARAEAGPAPAALAVPSAAPAVPPPSAAREVARPYSPSAASAAATGRGAHRGAPARESGGGDGGGEAGTTSGRWRPWRFRMSNDIWTRPVVWEGTLFVNSFEVHALEIATGRRRFKTRDVAWAMAVADGRVHAADGPSLYTVAATDGGETWRTGLNGWVYSIDAGGGAVCVGSRGGGVQVRSAIDGSEMWRADDAQQEYENPHSGPCVVGESVYYRGSGQLHAIDLTTGRRRWSRRVGEDVPSRPVLAGGVLYVTAGNQVLALDEESGAERWRAEGQVVLFTPPALDEAGGLYTADYLGTVSALDAATGELRWRARTGGARQGADPAVVAGGAVLVASGAVLYAFGAEDGRERWRYSARGEISGAPAAADGLVHVGSRDHSLHTLDLATGRPRWKLDTGGEVSGSPLVSGGRVFACSKDRCVYALDAAKGTAR